MSAPYLYEFLYRGKEDGTGDFHVILAQHHEPSFAGPTKVSHSHPMTPALAKENGFDLPAILERFDAALHTENVQLRATVASQQNEIEALQRALQLATGEPAA